MPPVRETQTDGNLIGYFNTGHQSGFELIDRLQEVTYEKPSKMREGSPITPGSKKKKQERLANSQCKDGILEKDLKFPNKICFVLLPDTGS